MKQIVLMIIALLFFLGCSASNQKKDEKPIVVTSTFALYDIVNHLGKDDIKTVMLIPPGKEIHSYEPTPKDIITLKKAKLFIFNGAGLEPWTGMFTTDGKTIDMSRFVDLHHFEEEHHHHHHTHSDEEEHSIDPHYWLDFDNMKRATDVIEKELVKLLPQNSKQIHQRAVAYKKMLTLLDQKYTKLLSHCKKDEIFVNHNAYSYLARRYRFYVDSLVGLSPDAQPNPKSIEKVLRGIKQEGAHTIFYESFENASVVRSIAKDSGIKVETLQPLANITAQEAQKKMNYESIAIENLNKLAEALECDEI